MHGRARGLGRLHALERRLIVGTFPMRAFHRLLEGQRGVGHRRELGHDVERMAERQALDPRELQFRLLELVGRRRDPLLLRVELHLRAQDVDAGHDAVLAQVRRLLEERMCGLALRTGRVGARLGKISELTIIVPLIPGGAKRLRAFLRLLRGNLSQGANKVGTLHTMRFVFFDNDTRLLFATSFDGDWDTYIDDFVAKIPDYLDIIDSAWDGWPGIRSPGAKDYLVKHQITAEGWYVAYPDLTVAEILRLQRIGKAVDEFLDKIG